MPSYAYFPRDYVRAINCLAQVADSFVGRWFQLEGSDAANEREGSRFLVRTFQFLFLVLHRSQVTP
jgi:hypothetical protein